MHLAPLSQWTKQEMLFKFWGDNVDKKWGVQDVRVQGNFACYALCQSYLQDKPHSSLAHQAQSPLTSSPFLLSIGAVCVVELLLQILIDP